MHLCWSLIRPGYYTVEDTDEILEGRVIKVSLDILVLPVFTECDSGIQAARQQDVKRQHLEALTVMYITFV